MGSNFSTRTYAEKMSELLPVLLQLCHRVSSDAFAQTNSEAEFCREVRADNRFVELDGSIQESLIVRAVHLRNLWLEKGVKEPIKQNFLDDIASVEKPVPVTFEQNEEG